MTMGPGRGRAAGIGMLAVLALAGGVSVARAQADPERARTAKTLFFDRKYAEARRAWEAVRATAAEPDKAAAAYWIARCSEGLGESERAFKEYGAFLALPSADRALAEEARTSRVGLAAKLYPPGRKEYAEVLRQALGDRSKTVRYYAALRVPELGPEMARLAVPVLRQILDQEKDPDLVDRAKLKLLRADPSALPPVLAGPPAAAGASPRLAGAPAARWVRVRITEKGGTHPKVAINLPLAFAEMVFKSLPDDVKADLRKKGYDADTFWDALRKLGPSQIISIEDDEGERIQIWTEE